MKCFPVGFPAAFLLCCLLMASCVTQAEREQQEKAAFEEELSAQISGVVSIHSIIRFASNSEKELSVPSFYHGRITVDRLPWLTSKDIRDIVPLERPAQKNTFDIQIVLTKHGHEQWGKLLAADNEDGFAVLIDGMLYQTFHPRRFYNPRSDSIVIDGPFDDVVAALLRKRAPFNYLKLNGIRSPDKTPAGNGADRTRPKQ